jgi:hypothetical protein
MFVFVPCNFYSILFQKPQVGAAEGQLENDNFEAAGEDGLY